MASQAVTSGDEKKNGGTIINAGNADSALINSKSVMSLAIDDGGYGSKVKALAGDSSVTGVQSAKGSGSPADSTTHIIRTVSENVRIPASDVSRKAVHDRQKSYGANTTTQIRAGKFDPTGIDGQRSNFSVAPTALNNTFKSTTSNVTDSSDGAIFGGANSTGELVYMYGALSPIQADYPAK
tara:strand:- start:790 stop:1335 length:546 start_codon:yes stop_codon:yes gene_type:complete